MVKDIFLVGSGKNNIIEIQETKGTFLYYLLKITKNTLGCTTSSNISTMGNVTF